MGVETLRRAALSLQPEWRRKGNPSWRAWDTWQAWGTLAVGGQCVPTGMPQVLSPGLCATWIWLDWVHAKQNTMSIAGRGGGDLEV